MKNNILFHKEKCDKMDNVIAILITSLFLIYPIMLNLLVFDIYKKITFVILISIVFLLLKYSNSEQIKLNKYLKIIFYLYILYLLILFISSLKYGHILQYSIYLIKFLFFILLFYYLNKNIISKILQIYAVIMVFIVIFNIINAIGVFFYNFNDIDNLTSIIQENGYRFKVFFGSYYELSNLNLLGYEVYRFQGLSEEAGTFALALFPAYFYFLYNLEKIKFFIILIGMCMTMSAAIPIVLIIIAIFTLITKEYKIAAIVLFSIVIFFILFYLNDIYILISQISLESHKLMSYERVISVYNRLEDIIYYLHYFDKLSIFDKLFGEGSGSPFISYPHSISIGWLVKFVEAGLLGGFFYIITFSFIFILVVFNIITNFYSDKVFYILSFSIIAFIIISSLRQPADSSFWHMSFYAFYFHYLVKYDNN